MGYASLLEAPVSRNSHAHPVAPMTRAVAMTPLRRDRGSLLEVEDEDERLVPSSELGAGALCEGVAVRSWVEQERFRDSGP